MSVFIGVTLIILAYLSGSIPTGYLIARLYGVDVTSSGSGRTGGTNVLRAVGKGAAGLTVFLDVMKGILPIFFFDILADVGIVEPIYVAIAAAAAVLGHNHSIFLGFRGGAGGGTAVGAIGGLNLNVGIITAVFSLGMLMITRYASMLTTTVAVMGLVILTIFAVVGWIPYEYIVTGVLNCILIPMALRQNYARILAGTERRVGQKSENSAQSTS